MDQEKRNQTEKRSGKRKRDLTEEEKARRRERERERRRHFTEEQRKAISKSFHTCLNI